jgi:hypothetical protein
MEPDVMMRDGTVNRLVQVVVKAARSKDEDRQLARAEKWVWREMV